MRMTDERAVMMAEVLRATARRVRAEMADLTAETVKCSGCGLGHARDLDEWQLAKELGAAAHKLERIAASIEGRIQRRAAEPERTE
jgi:hypothetical protein